MSNKYKILLGTAIVIYVIYHLATLIYSPLPWFDEVTFGSITNSYLNHHTFYEEARIIVLPKQKLDYGPVYFIMQAAVIKMLGFSIFNFRITGLLFGLMDLFLIYRICLQFKFSVNAAILTVAMIALEPNFNQFLHSGRNDFVTLFFFFLSYLVFMKAGNNARPANLLLAALTGVLLSLSLLTTPRVIFTFAFYAFYFVYQVTDIKNRDWKALLLKYISVAIGFIFVYAIWIYSAFGSVNNFIYYYTHSDVIKEHTGMGQGISLRYNLLIYAYAFFAFLILLKNKAVKKNIEIVLFTLPVIVAFLLLVTGGISGRYFALVMPFAAILIVGVTVNMYNNKLLKMLTYVMPVFFGLIFIFKGAYIFSTLKQHDPHYNEAVISKYITPNTSIAGDFRYYYIARDNNCSFLSLSENGPWDNKIKYFLDHKINCFIINKDNPDKEAFEKVLLSNNYKFVTELDSDNSSSFFHKLIMKTPYKISEDYSCYIYKYIGG